MWEASTTCTSTRHRQAPIAKFRAASLLLARSSPWSFPSRWVEPSYRGYKPLGSALLSRLSVVRTMELSSTRTHLEMDRFSFSKQARGPTLTIIKSQAQIRQEHGLLLSRLAIA